MQVQDLKPLVGSEITIDRADFLSGKYSREIQDLLVRRSALVFPGLHLTDEEQLQFARTIGDVHKVGGDQELQNISMDPEINPSANYARGAFYWHIDGANDEVPAKATMLSARTLPAEGEGGETLVANTYAAYDDLPDEEKEALEGIGVRHALEASQRYIRPQPTVAELKAWQTYPARTHPLVWHHRHGLPAAGRQLFLRGRYEPGGRQHVALSSAGVGHSGTVRLSPPLAGRRLYGVRQHRRHAPGR